MDLTLKEFANIVGITEKRIWAIERMPEPVVNERTLYGIARAMKLTFDELDAAWKNTPVRPPRIRKAGNRSSVRVVRIPDDAYAGIERRATAQGQSVEGYLTALGRLKPGAIMLVDQLPDSAEAPESVTRRGALGKKSPAPRR